MNQPVIVFSLPEIQSRVEFLAEVPFLSVTFTDSMYKLLLSQETPGPLAVVCALEESRFKVVKAARPVFARARVLVLVEEDDSVTPQMAIEEGASGVLSLGLDMLELLLLANNDIVPPLLRKPGRKLTRRQLQVLQLIVEGKSSAQIGQILEVSEHTAKTHVRKIGQRYGVNGRPAIVAYGFRQGDIV